MVKAVDSGASKQAGSRNKVDDRAVVDMGSFPSPSGHTVSSEGCRKSNAQNSNRLKVGCKVC